MQKPVVDHVLVLAAAMLSAAGAAEAQQSTPPRGGVQLASADTAADLGPASTVEQLIVTAPRKESTARAEEFAAPNLVNVQSAEQIAKYPDFNAAEALSRVPGVSLSSDTGEGRFINIRGIDANLNGATFGGVVLLNTNPGGTVFGSGRAVEFDTIPIGAVDRIVVTKTGLPDHEAEGLGGSVELTPRSAAAIDKPFAEVILGGGYEGLRPNWSPFRGEVTVGGRFGIPGFGGGGWITNERPFALLITASENDDRRAVDDFEEAYGVDAGYAPAAPFATQNKVFDTTEMRRYQYHRRRFGVGGDFEFQPNDNNTFYARASVAGYIESVNRQRLIFSGLEFAADGASLDPNGSVAAGTAVFDPGNANGFLAPNAQSTVALRDQEETHRNTVVAVGGRSTFGRFTLDYQGAYSRATFSKGHDRNWAFTNPNPVSLAYDNITNPSVPRFNVLNGVNVQDPSLYTLTGFGNSQEQAVDAEWSYAANLSFPVELFGAEGRFKFGTKARLRDKSDIPTSQSYSVPPLALTSVQGGGPYTSFYDGAYSIGFSPSADRLNKYLTANEGLFALQGGQNALLHDQGSRFFAKEDIYAGYGQYDTTLGAWGLLVGARVENTHAVYTGFITSSDANGNPTVTPDTRTHDYTNVFPTVQIRYEFNPRMILRATYSTDIGRPGFSQITPSTVVNVGNQTVTTGNPNLSPTFGNNLDLSFDVKTPFGGTLQLGAFDKLFDNYVAARILRGPYPGITGTATIATFSNIPSAYARGFEGAFDQPLKFLPAPFDGLGLSGNFTYVDSSIELRQGDHAMLPATSKWTANGAIYYAAHGLDIQVSLAEVSKSLFGIGAVQTQDLYQHERLTLDLTSSYQVNDKVQVYFNAKNLLNTPLRYDEGDASRPIQREFYDVTLEAGVRVHF